MGELKSVIMNSGSKYVVIHGIAEMPKLFVHNWDIREVMTIKNIIIVIITLYYTAESYALKEYNISTPMEGFNIFSCYGNETALVNCTQDEFETLKCSSRAAVLCTG